MKDEDLHKHFVALDQAIIHASAILQSLAACKELPALFQERAAQESEALFAMLPTLYRIREGVVTLEVYLERAQEAQCDVPKS